jgi:hypothetical protein
MSGILSSMVGVSPAAPAGPAPGYYLYTESTSETQANQIMPMQSAIMGHNSDGTIRAAYTGNSTGSTQGFVKPILYNPTTNAITFGTKVNSQQMTSSALYACATISEQQYDIGTADATTYAITYLPNNNSPNTLVGTPLSFSMNSAGAVTMGTGTTFSPDFQTVGTANNPTTIHFDGLYGGVPRYTLVSRNDTVSTRTAYVLSRTSNAISITRSAESQGLGNRADGAASRAGVGEASCLAYIGSSGEIFALTFGATTRESTTYTSGLRGSRQTNTILLTTGTSAKYMMYGRDLDDIGATSRIVNVTYSSSTAPTISLGANLYEENSSFRAIFTYKLVKSWNANEAFLFYLESNVLYVKTATISGDTISWSSATSIGALTATSLDVQVASVDANKKYFIGVARTSGGDVTAFAVKYVP